MSGTNMREDKRENVEIVYSAMRSLYEQRQPKDWRKSLPPKEIEAKVNNILEMKSLETKKQRTMHRVVVHRCLKVLMKEKRVVKLPNTRGEYTIDFAIQEAKKTCSAFTRTVLSVNNYRELKGETSQTIQGQKIDTPFCPINSAPETVSISRHIEKWRLQIHGEKDIAGAEANAWINSFINALSCEVESGDTPLKIRPDKLVSTEKRDGVNAFIFRKAMEIMLELFESLDLESLKRAKDSGLLVDAQMSVRISFNPVTFIQLLKRYRDEKEIELNRTQVQSEFPWKTFELNKSLNKRVFKEIFADQANDLWKEL